MKTLMMRAVVVLAFVCCVVACWSLDGHAVTTGSGTVYDELRKLASEGWSFGLSVSIAGSRRMVSWIAYRSGVEKMRFSVTRSVGTFSDTSITAYQTDYRFSITDYAADGVSIKNMGSWRSAQSRTFGGSVGMNYVTQSIGEYSNSEYSLYNFMHSAKAIFDPTLYGDCGVFQVDYIGKIVKGGQTIESWCRTRDSTPLIYGYVYNPASKTWLASSRPDWHEQNEYSWTTTTELVSGGKKYKMTTTNTVVQGNICGSSLNPLAGTNPPRMLMAYRYEDTWAKTINVYCDGQLIACNQSGYTHYDQSEFTWLPADAYRSWVNNYNFITGARYKQDYANTQANAWLSTDSSMTVPGGWKITIPIEDGLIAGIQGVGVGAPEAFNLSDFSFGRTQVVSTDEYEAKLAAETQKAQEAKGLSAEGMVTQSQTLNPASEIVSNSK